MTPHLRTSAPPRPVAGDARAWLNRVTPLVGASGERLVLRRAWPRSADHALLEYTGARTPEGVVVGQWFADAERAHRVAAAMGADAVEAPRSPGIVLHRRGADRRLAALPALLADPSARLVVHRPERRAVVRLDPRPGICAVRRWAKVVRPERVDALVAGSAALERAGVSGPRLVDVRADRGVTVWSDVPGRPLADLLRDPCLDATMARVGVVVRRLHELAVPPRGAAPASADAEQQVLARWLGYLAQYDPATHRRVAALHEPAVRLLRRDARVGSRTAVHRDLHDGQVLVAGMQVGLLDPDTLALGEPELDLGNLIAHLQLAACAGRCDDTVRRSAVSALLDGYGRDGVRCDRMGAYTAASLLRLVAVHAVRPATRSAAVVLADHAERVLQDGATAG